MIPLFLPTDTQWQLALNEFKSNSSNTGIIKSFTTFNNENSTNYEIDNFKNWISQLNAEEHKNIKVVEDYSNLFCILATDPNEARIVQFLHSNNIKPIIITHDQYLAARNAFLTHRQKRNNESYSAFIKAFNIDEANVPNIFGEDTYIFTDFFDLLNTSFPPANTSISNDIILEVENPYLSYAIFALKLLAITLAIACLAIIALTVAAAVFSAGPFVIAATTLTATAITGIYAGIGVAAGLLALPGIAVAAKGAFTFFRDENPNSNPNFVYPKMITL